MGEVINKFTLTTLPFAGSDIGLIFPALFRDATFLIKSEEGCCFLERADEELVDETILLELDENNLCANDVGLQKEGAFFFNSRLLDTLSIFFTSVAKTPKLPRSFTDCF